MLLHLKINVKIRYTNGLLYNFLMYKKLVFLYCVLMSCTHAYGFITMPMQKTEDTQATNQDFVSKLNNYKNVTSKCSF